MTIRYYAIKEDGKKQYFRVIPSEAVVLGTPGRIQVVEVSEEDAKKIQERIDKDKGLAIRVEEGK